LLSRDRFACELCNKVYVVASLARWCEQKHLESDYDK